MQAAAQRSRAAGERQGGASVGVVIAVKNGEAYLAEALDSVCAQTRPASEIVVVDGHSTDQSREVASRYPHTRVLLQTNRGFAGAWNEGIRACRSEYVAILDSDDRWAPGKLAAQVAALEAAPEQGYVLAHTRFFRAPGVPLPPGFDRVDLSRDHSAPFPSVMLARRSLFDEVGFFEEQWEISSDIEWFRRVADAGVLHAVLPEVLLWRRIHDTNLSYRPPDPQAFPKELLTILKRSLDRRRAARATHEKSPQ